MRQLAFVLVGPGGAALLMGASWDYPIPELAARQCHREVDMRLRCMGSIVLFGILALTSAAFGERAPEDRNTATHVIVGTVEGVYMRETPSTRDYIIEIAIEKVEKGKNLKPRAAIYVGCYLWNPNEFKGKKLSKKDAKRKAMRGAAYDSVPKEGDRVKIWAKQQGGKYVGVYPSFYDVLKGNKPTGTVP
jgi:hypothetical protein